MAIKVWVGGDAGNENDWGTAANWSPSGVPANGDDVYVEDPTYAIDGSDQSAVALDSLNIAQNFESTIGSEATPLEVGASQVNIGYVRGAGTPGGATRIHLDLGSATAANVVVFDTATSGEDDLHHPVRLIADNASTTIDIRRGRVSIMDDPGDTGEVSSIDVAGGNSEVIVGVLEDNAALTIGTLTVAGGRVECYNNLTTLNVDGGRVLTEGPMTITTASVRDGRFVSNATGTITTVDLDNGVVDLTQSKEPRTISTLTHERGSIIFDPDLITISTYTPDGELVRTLTAA